MIYILYSMKAFTGNKGFSLIEWQFEENISRKNSTRSQSDHRASIGLRSQMPCHGANYFALHVSFAGSIEQCALPARHPSISLTNGTKQRVSVTKGLPY